MLIRVCGYCCMRKVAFWQERVIMRGQFHTVGCYLEILWIVVILLRLVTESNCLGPAVDAKVS